MPRTSAWVLSLLLAGCFNAPEPAVLLELHCEVCGTGDAEEDSCDACFEIATRSLAATRPNIKGARTVLAKACAVHHPDSCNLMAKMVRDGRGGPPDLKRAISLFTIACEKGDIQSACTERAMAQYDGVGLKQNTTAAVQLFASSCHHKTDPQPKSCAALALAYVSGEGVEAKDEEKAIELLGQSCSDQYAAGCVALGDLYMDKRPVKRADREEFPKTIAKAYLDACEIDARFGCFELGAYHESGDAPEANDDKAAIYFQKTCNIHPPAGCFEAAELMREGRVKAREGEIESLYNVACEHGHTPACSMRNQNEE